jgi:hypothetical protein
MSYQASFGTIESTGEPIAPPKPASPFRMAVLADFSGRRNRGVTGDSDDIASRRLLRVSRDTLDEVMAKLGVKLQLPVGDKGEANLSFTSLDDFHPDQLHDRVEPVADAYDSDEKSELMNSVLHHPDFQALESAWRGLAFLMSRSVKGSTVEFFLLDISLPELAADLKSSEDLTAGGVYRLLIEKGVRGPQGEPWAALIGDFIFDLTGEHAELLGRLAKIANETNAPFLTTVDPKVLDKSFAQDPDAAPAWQALRELPESALLGLAAPRFLLRLPYGENTQSIDKFSYEEVARPPDRSHYLWGNPAHLCGTLLAQALHKQGWGFKPGAVVDLRELPIHAYTVDGEEEVTLAEAWLVRPQPEKLIKLGIMPFLCVRGEGTMQLVRFLSLAQPPEDQPACDLQGRWAKSGLAPAAPKIGAPTAKVGMVGDVASIKKQRQQEVEIIPMPARETAQKEAPAAEPEAPVEPEAPAEEPAPEPAASEPAETTEAPAGEPQAAPAEEEMDPELAALLKELE